ncbi:MAG: hypothetical protein HQL53_11315 [Magnetococcales bacterium]|nr:hypothetical protein [Magnetococcales bacterium]
MALTFADAMRAWGIPRSTFYKAKKSGRLSVVEIAPGKPGIEPAEMQRVWGKPRPMVHPGGLQKNDGCIETGVLDPIPQDGPPFRDRTDDLVDALKKQIESLEDQVTHLRQREREQATMFGHQLQQAHDENARLLEVVQGQLRLIPDQRPKPEKKPLHDVADGANVKVPKKKRRKRKGKKKKR